MMEYIVTNIDLYLNALTLINWDGALLMLAMFVSVLTSMGAIGSVGLQLFDQAWEYFGYLDEGDFWALAHDDTDGFEGSPPSPFTVPDYMLGWPTLQERQEAALQAWERLRNLDATSTTLSHLLEVPEPRENTEEEQELDELWERIYGTPVQDIRTSLLHQYMLAQN